MLFCGCFLLLSADRLARQVRMGRNSDWDWGGTEAVINRIASEENSLKKILKVNHIRVSLNVCQFIEQNYKNFFSRIFANIFNVSIVLLASS